MKDLTVGLYEQINEKIDRQAHAVQQYKIHYAHLLRTLKESDDRQENEGQKVSNMKKQFCSDVTKQVWEKEKIKLLERRSTLQEFANFDAMERQRRCELHQNLECKNQELRQMDAPEKHISFFPKKQEIDKLHVARGPEVSEAIPKPDEADVMSPAEERKLLEKMNERSQSIDMNNERVKQAADRIGAGVKGHLLRKSIIASSGHDKLNAHSGSPPHDGSLPDRLNTVDEDGESEIASHVVEDPIHADEEEEAHASIQAPHNSKSSMGSPDGKDKTKELSFHSVHTEQEKVATERTEEGTGGEGKHE